MSLRPPEEIKRQVKRYRIIKSIYTREKSKGCYIESDWFFNTRGIFCYTWVSNLFGEHNIAGYLIQRLLGDKDVFYAKYIQALPQGKAEVVCRKRHPVCVTIAAVARRRFLKGLEKWGVCCLMYSPQSFVNVWMFNDQWKARRLFSKQSMKNPRLYRTFSSHFIWHSVSGYWE